MQFYLHLIASTMVGLTMLGFITIVFGHLTGWSMLVTAREDLVNTLVADGKPIETNWVKVGFKTIALTAALLWLRWFDTLVMFLIIDATLACLMSSANKVIVTKSSV